MARAVQRATEAKADKDAPKKEEPKQKIVDMRPKIQGDKTPMSNYEDNIAGITNAAKYGVDKAPIVYVMGGWHAQNQGTPIESWHFDISLDGSTRLHVYFDSMSGSVSIVGL
jgi:hypothetical protein